MSSLSVPHKYIEPYIAQGSTFTADDDSLAIMSKDLKSLIDDSYRNSVSQKAFSNLISVLCRNGTDLILYNESRDVNTMKYKLIGVAILDCLLDVNDEYSPFRRTEIIGLLCKIFEIEKPNVDIYERVLRNAAYSIGHFARIASTTEIEFIQNIHIPLIVKLIVHMKSDGHRYAGILIFHQLTVNLPQLIYSKRKILVPILWDVVCDKKALVRNAAASALEACLQLISQRESMVEYIKIALKTIQQNLSANTSQEITLGGLMILDIISNGSIVSINDLQNPNFSNFSFDQAIDLTLKKRDTNDIEVKHKIIDMLPRLALTFQSIFLSSQIKVNGKSIVILDAVINYLVNVCKVQSDRSIAYISLGKLVLAMSAHLRSPTIINNIFEVIKLGFKEPFCLPALHSLGMIVSISPIAKKLVNNGLIELMFRCGFNQDLIDNLKVIVKHVPTIRNYVQKLLSSAILLILDKYNAIVDDCTPRLKSSTSLVKKNQTAPNNNVLGSPSKINNRTSSLWGSNHVGIMFHSTAYDQVTTPQPVANYDKEIILALQTLSSSELYPKYIRENYLPYDSSKRFSQTDASTVQDIQSDDTSVVTPDDQSLKILEVLKRGVVKFLNDNNRNIRLIASLTCTCVIDNIIVNIELNSLLYDIIEIIDRLLLLGVGDDDNEIRFKIFSSIQPSLDLVLSQCNNINCLIEGLQDEFIDVRSAAMTLICRIAHFDTLRIMPLVRLHLKNLIRHLYVLDDKSLKFESVILLQAMVRGSNMLIAPYVTHILQPLMTLINDSSPTVVGVCLSTIAELAFASPDSVKGYLDDLMLRLIRALNDTSSNIQRDIAVAAIGKLVPALTMVTEEPYTKYPGLFDGLVRAIRNDDESYSTLRYEAIRTVGLLGIVDSGVYEIHLSKLRQSDSTNYSNDELYEKNEIDKLDDDTIPKVTESENKIDPSSNGTIPKAKLMQKYYFNIVVNQLVSILKDSSSSMHHFNAATATVKIISILGNEAIHRLSEVIDAFAYRLRQVELGNNLKDTLLDYLVSMVEIIGPYMKKYVKTFIELISEFLTSHLQRCLELIDALNNTISKADFQLILIEVIPLLLDIITAENMIEKVNMVESLSPTASGKGLHPITSITKPVVTISNKTNDKSKVNTKETQYANIPNSCKIMTLFARISYSLGMHLQQILPVITSVLLNNNIVIEERKLAVSILLYISNDNDLLSFSSRIIHPYSKLLGSTTDLSLQGFVLTALSAILCQIGDGFIPYVIPLRRKLSNVPTKDGNKLSQLDEFESLLTRLLKQRSLPSVPSNIQDLSIDISDNFRSQSHYYPNLKSPELNVIPLNIQSLESQLPIGIKIDYIDWIKRLQLQIIRHSPSPIIRACVTLAKLYRPLTEALFNSAFYCIWEELISTGDSLDDIPFINGIELLLESSNTPQNIASLLLNLARFMDMQDKRLPLDVKLLAQRSNESNMYAKCLRYRELEFYSKNISPSIECIEDLIAVSNELGLRDRAMGVLQNVISDYPKVDIQPVWLEKLNLWEEAKELYQTHLISFKSVNPDGNPCESPGWMTNELGVLRCSVALGELSYAIQHANKLKDQLKSADSLVVNHLSTLTASSWMLEVQRLGGHSAWLLGKWDNLERLVEYSSNDSNHHISQSFSVRLDRNLDFYKTILSIHKQDYSYAMTIIAATRNKLSNEICSLLSESYPRAYRAMVSMQILSELEEIIEYKESIASITNSSMSVNIESANIPSYSSSNSLAGNDSTGNFSSVSPSKRSMWPSNDDTTSWNSMNTSSNILTRDLLRAKKENLIKKWRSRLKWAPKEISVFRQILSVHTLVAEPLEDLDSWLELVTLCRKEGMFTLCENVLRRLGAPLVPRANSTGADIFPRSPLSSSDANDLKIASPAELLSSEEHIAFDKILEKSSGNIIPIPLGQRPNNMATCRVLFSTMKYWWSSGDRQKALSELNTFLKSLPKVDLNSKSGINLNNVGISSGLNTRGSFYENTSNNNNDLKLFRMKCLLKRAEWMRAISEDSVEDVMQTLSEAKELVPDHYPVWHAWAVFNYDQLQEADNEKGNRRDSINNSTKFFNLKNRTKGKQKDLEVTRQRRASTLDGVTEESPTIQSIASSNPLSGSKRPKARKKSINISGGALSLANLLTTVKLEDKITGFVIEAIKGFVRSIILGQGQPSSNILQDILRLITLWFSYGSKDGVSVIIETELDQLSPENWLSVLPQLIARMHVRTPEISSALRKLLSKVAAIHPQALVCPISVALNTTDEQQKTVALEILNEMSKRRSQLVEEARMVSRELMRVAITPQELWFDGIEKACTSYLEGNISQMMKTLLSLHCAMDEDDSNNETLPNNMFENWLKSSNSPPSNSATVTHIPMSSGKSIKLSTKSFAAEGLIDSVSKISNDSLRDISFRHRYGKLLADAEEWLLRFQVSGLTPDLHQAWDIYYSVFKKIESQIKTYKELELNHISPKLTAAKDLKLAIPGTYQPFASVISISKFIPSIKVIQSKQRPRKINMRGSNGTIYPFLLKGNEDLRQDERVMQLFGLINVCLNNDNRTKNRMLDIVRYSVLPLSNNSGVIGWVQNCDTLNQLITDYRQSKGLKPGIEMKLLQSKSFNYDMGISKIPMKNSLTLMQKVEIFESVLEETSGLDISNMLWLKSKSADVWVDRRNNFTKSMAVMSMAGYILGLGDRHPSNLMLHRVSGRVVHIDFGDCFEITKNRQKFPEIIPFRLTRMLTKTMEKSGIEGTYRVNCEKVMKVLRDNKDSVMAMLEAFVYDPLISWRLLSGKSDLKTTTSQLPNNPAVLSPEQALSPSNHIRSPNNPIEMLRDKLRKHSIVLDNDEQPNSSAPEDFDIQRSYHSLSAVVPPVGSVIESANITNIVNRQRNSEVNTTDDSFVNMNSRALEVINRIQAKLTGRDFTRSEENEELTIEQQVEKLIVEATSNENLCLLFAGWCPAW